MKKVVIVIFAFLLSALAHGQEADMRGISAEDLCKDKIMTISSNDLKRINPNALISACQEMPLADDLAIQMLSVVVGEPLLVVLDVFSSLSGTAHGMEADSQLLILASPVHGALKAFNFAMLGVMIVLMFIGAYSQIFSWQKGDFKVDFAKWFNRHGPTRMLIIFASTPIFGWLTPIQFISLLIVVGFVFIAKFVVVYLFLASFLGESISDVRDYITEDLKDPIGGSIIMYRCDLDTRADLIRGIADNVNAAMPLRSEIEKSGLYQCLTSEVGGSGKPVLRDNVGGNLRYIYKPAHIAQTESCAREHEPELREYGMSLPKHCGWIEFNLPDNVNRETSIDNAIAMYANSDIERYQRSVALSMVEIACRGDAFLDGLSVLEDNCLVARETASTYQYEWAPTGSGEGSVLAEQRQPFSGAERTEFNANLNRQFANLRASFGENMSVVASHIADLLAPTKSDNQASQSVKDSSEALRSRILNGYQDDTSVIGYAETDVDFLVDSMKRGAWASGGLFFGKLTEGIEKEKLANKMASVYSLQEPEQLDVFRIRQGAALINLYIAQQDSSGDINSSSFATGFIMPRLNMYGGDFSCWEDQSACRIPALNPFTYLTDKGATIMDEAMNRFVVSTLVYRITNFVTGRNSPGQEGTKIMLAKAIADFNFLYLIMGVVLVFVIPAMPLFKIMVMMVNWTYDLVRELLALQITLCLSAVGEQGNNLLGQDVRASLARLLGLGLYFLFMMLGVVAMFLIFAFLFSMNILVLGALSNMVDWTGVGNGVQSMVIAVVFDVIVTIILVYEIKKCTPYIEKFPMMLSENFGVRITSSAGVVQQAMQKMQTVMVTDVSRFLDASLRGK